jgi:putative thioredoxin
MGSSISVNETTFATEVLAASYQKPVLVDFFATWCGPCQLLKPILETLVQEYDFVLAKVDIDTSPKLAREYGVTGVPDVRVVLNGDVQPGFVGMVQEPEIRNLLHRLQLTSDLDRALEGIYHQAAQGEIAAAQAELEQLLATHPDNAGLVLEAANFYVEADQLETAEHLLGRIPAHDRDLSGRARGIYALIQFKQAVQSPTYSKLDRIYQQAAQDALAQNYEAALQGFLDLVQRDRMYRQDGGRRAMLAIFDLLGMTHPLTLDYRKRLTMALY